MTPAGCTSSEIAIYLGKQRTLSSIGVVDMGAEEAADMLSMSVESDRMVLLSLLPDEFCAEIEKAKPSRANTSASSRGCVVP